MSRTLNASVVLLTSSDQNISGFGTAFPIHRAGNITYLLSCAHVIRDIGGPDKVRIANHPAIVVALGSDSGLDLSILEVTDLTELPLVQLGISGKTDDTFVASGFQLYGRNYLVKTIRGKFGEQAGLESRENVGRISVWELLLDNEYRLQPGYSGAPVFNEATGTVVGVVSHREGEGRRGLAISLEALKDIWPEMPPDLLRGDSQHELVLTTGADIPSASYETFSTGIDTDTGSDLIFVSYSQIDGAEFATRLCSRLNMQGLNIWCETRDILDNVERPLLIDKVIRSCWLLIFVMTTDSISSLNCQDEWSRALSFKKPVMPLIVHNVAPPLRLEHLKSINFTGAFDTAVAELYQYILWLRTPEGQLQTLRNRLSEFQREHNRASNPARVEAGIETLQKQIAYKEYTLQNLEIAYNEHQRLVHSGIEADRQRFANTREQDRTAPAQRVVGIAPQGVSQSFKDRTYYLTTIINDLIRKDTNYRAVSIYGRAGVGKTALACRVMVELERDHENVDSLIYLSTRNGLGIDLERVYLYSALVLGGDSTQRLNQTWADTKIGIAAKIQILLEHYGDKLCVILLDNLEDVLDNEGRLTDLDLGLFVDMFLRQDHGARLLITSREPLYLTSDLRSCEHRIFLEEGLPAEDAINLLKSFDQENNLGLKNADPALLHEIVEKTHGFPRALEAVAGILVEDPLLQVEDLLADEKLFDQEVIQNLVREAQSRLDVDERYVMQALSVYAQPVTPAAIRFLLGPFVAGIDLNMILKRLARGRYITTKRNTGEIAVHPLDRQYSYSQIPSSEAQAYNLKSLELRAAEYYAQIRSPREAWKTIDDLEPQLIEFNHRIRANDYNGAAALIDQIDSEYLSLWGHVKRVLAMRVQLLNNVTDSRLEQNNLGALGMAYRHFGRYEQAIDCYQQAIALAHSFQYRSEESSWLAALGGVYHRIGRYDQAVDYKQQALTIARAIGDRQAEAVSLSGLAYIYLQTGRYKQALDYYNQALVISRALGDKREEDLNLGGIGLIYAESGEHTRALEYYEHSLRIVREMGNRREEAYRLSSLGLAYDDLGEYVRAIDHQLQSIEIMREIGGRREEGYWLGYLGKCYADLRDYESAINYLQQSLAISEEVNNPPALNVVGGYLAQVYLYLNQLQDASRTIMAAKQHRFPQNDHYIVALYGVILHRSESRVAARTAFKEALTLGNALLTESPHSYAARYTIGLALAGLALLASGKRQAQLSARVTTAYQAALANCAAPGVVANTLRLLDELCLGVPGSEVLVPARTILSGEQRRSN